MGTEQLEAAPPDTAQESASDVATETSTKEEPAAPPERTGGAQKQETPEAQAQLNTDEVEQQEDQRTSRTKFFLIVLVVVVLLAALLVLGIVPRVRRNREIKGAAVEEKTSLPIVHVIRTERAEATTELELPGNIEALQVASISARTSGYLKRWYVDIGDRVRAGQLLAEIDAPEVQQEIEQARGILNQARAGLGQSQANLQQARTNAEYARVTYERYHYLVGQGVVSKQDADDKQAAYEVAKAGVNAQVANVNASQAVINSNEANVRRLLELQGYQRVYAPFNGVVTARYVDNGSLIGGGSAPASGTTGPSGGNSSGSTTSGTAAPAAGSTTGTTGGALYSIARIDTLRIYVNVPQTLIESVHPGQLTEISVRELPQRKFVGRVGRTADALDPATRTLLTEVQIKNTDYALLPGMYAQVKFNVTLPEAPVRVPSNALIVRSQGTQVAIVTPDQKVHIQKVTVGRDYGKSMDIIEGLDEGAQLVIDPTAGLQEGTPVRVSQAQNNNQGAGGAQGGDGGGAGGGSAGGGGG